MGGWAKRRLCPQQLVVAAENKASGRQLDRKTAEKKENRCQPSSKKDMSHTVKSRFLPFSQSSKTMALWCLIKGVIEGVRELPSAPNRSLPSCVSLSNALRLGHCFSSSLFHSMFPIWINAYLSSGSEPQPRPAPVGGDWISNYLLNNRPFAIITPSVYQSQQVRRDGSAWISLRERVERTWTLTFLGTDMSGAAPCLN